VKLMAMANNSEAETEHGRWTDPWSSGPFSMHFDDVRGLSGSGCHLSFAVDNSTFFISHVDQGALLIR